MKTIAVEEIPQGLRRNYPYAEWLAMSVGQATVVEANGRNVTGMYVTIGSYFSRHGHHGMRVMQRQGRLYVARTAEDE